MWPEILPPFFIICGSLFATAIGIKYVDRWENEGKVGIFILMPKRYGVKHWDRKMVARDKRITGSENRQQILVLYPSFAELPDRLI